MISPLEMRVLDRNAQYFGISTLDLMEAAGKAVAEVARSEFGAAGKHVFGPCGTGDNGGGGPRAPPPPSEEGPGAGPPPPPPGQLATKGGPADIRPPRGRASLA